MRDFSGNHDWLSINTATLRKQSGARLVAGRVLQDLDRDGTVEQWIVGAVHHAHCAGADLCLNPVAPE